MHTRTLAILLGLIFGCRAFSQEGGITQILAGATLSEGYSINLDSSEHRTDWMSSEGNNDLLLEYPAHQQWGAVFITHGQSNQPDSIDVAGNQSLVVELTGTPGATVQVGMKDVTQPSDGSEAKVHLTLYPNWQTYTIPLTAFTKTDLKRLSVVTEIVFSGTDAITVRVRKIAFSKASAQAEMVLPQFAFGGGWYSALYLSNASGMPVQFDVSCWSDDGSPLTLPGFSSSSIAIDLAPNGLTVLEAPNLGALVQGYLTTSLPVGVSGFGVFRQSVSGRADQEAGVPLSFAGFRSARLVWDDAGLTTSIAITNLAPVENRVRIDLYDIGGLPLGSSFATLPASGKLVGALSSFDGLSAVTGTRGTATLSSETGAFAVLALRFGGEAFTTIPVDTEETATK